MAYQDHIVIIHGWSDDAESFKALGEVLETQLNAPVTNVNLADWLSLNDEITFNDLRCAMDQAWKKKKIPTTPKSVNIISHSTGALVTRDWMTYYYKSHEKCPIKRHIMLAPANYGSPLAHTGRTIISRVIKGFNTGFQTGTNILYGLELASDYTWNLADKDVFNDKWYGPDKIMSSVLVGNSGWDEFIKKIANEEGSDGTVRVSTANLNAKKIAIYFDRNGNPKTFSDKDILDPQPSAFCVLHGVNHGSITQPNTKLKQKIKALNAGTEANNIAELILQLLTLSETEWQQWKKISAIITDELYQSTANQDYYHAYQNTVVRAMDNLENPVEDYVVEFQPDKTKNQSFKLKDIGGIFKRNIIRDIHKYTNNSAMRAFYLDVTEIEKQINKIDGKLYLDFDPSPLIKIDHPSMQSKHPVGYTDINGILITAEIRKMLFNRNITLMLDLNFHREINLAKTFVMGHWSNVPLRQS